MKEKKLISIKEASKISPYEQGYLSLLARRGELKAKKVGRNWFTTIAWLNEYIEEKKPDKIIEASKGKKYFWRNIFLKKEFFGMVFLVVCFLLLIGFWVWEDQVVALMNDENEIQEVFISEEIVKIPNEDGGYDIYESGKRKIK